MQLGFIGVGNIGTPICQHLINAGHNISAYDIDRENLEYIASLGAKPSDTPRQVAELSDIVFSSLPGPKEIEDVVLGTDGIITAQKPGLMYADLSTNNPSSAKFVSEHLINAGMSMIDAPVSGGVIGAKQGTLAVMVDVVTKMSVTVPMSTGVIGIFTRVSWISPTIFIRARGGSNITQ